MAGERYIWKNWYILFFKLEINTVSKRVTLSEINNEKRGSKIFNDLKKITTKRMSLRRLSRMSTYNGDPYFRLSKLSVNSSNSSSSESLKFNEDIFISTNKQKKVNKKHKGFFKT